MANVLSDSSRSKEVHRASHARPSQNGSDLLKKSTLVVWAPRMAHVAGDRLDREWRRSLLGLQSHDLATAAKPRGDLCSKSQAKPVAERVCPVQGRGISRH